MKVVLLFGLLSLSGAALAAPTAMPATKAKVAPSKSDTQTAPPLEMKNPNPILTPAANNLKSITQVAQATDEMAIDKSLATAITAAPKKEDDKKISGQFTAGRSNSLYLENGESKTASWDFTGSLAYKLPHGLSASAYAEGSEDIKTPEASDYGKGTIGLSYKKPSEVPPVVELVPAIKLGFPISRAARSTSLRNSVTLGLVATPNSDYLFSKKLGLELSLTGTRNIHDYDTGANGKPNSQYTSAQSLKVGWNFTDSISISAAYTHINAWTYQGATKEYFNHAEELGYELNKSWAVAVGHSYGNPYTSVWNADHQSYNTNLTDEQNSVVYGQVAYTF